MLYYCRRSESVRRAVTFGKESYILEILAQHCRRRKIAELKCWMKNPILNERPANICSKNAVYIVFTSDRNILFHSWYRYSQLVG